MNDEAADKIAALTIELSSVVSGSRRYHQIHSALHYLRNKPRLNAKGIAWRKSHPQETRVYSARHRTKHPDSWRASVRKSVIKSSAKRSAYAKKMRPVFRARERRRDRERRATDSAFVIKKRLRSRLSNALAGLGIKSEPTLNLLGCSVPFLLKHLESQFKPGMSWENRDKWHIDHKLPCSKFDLTKPVQQRACFHWSNLRPLWKRENLSKHDKIVTCQPELTLVMR